MWRLVILLLVVVSGCNKPPATIEVPATTTRSDAPKSPSSVVYEQIRAGAFQYGSVMDTLTEALDRCLALRKSAKVPAKAALEEVRDALDSAGAAVEDFQLALAEEAEFEKNFKAEDERRLKAIDGGNDALHILGDAQAVLGSYSHDVGKPLDQELESLIQLAMEDLKEAIQAYGGKVEIENVAGMP